MLASLLLLAMAACGGGETFGGGGGDGGDGIGGDGDDGGGDDVVLVDSLSVSASSNQLPADADTTAEGVLVTVLLRDANNNVVPGVGVSFAATSGELQVNIATTGADGRATATLTTAGNPSLRTITVIANGGGQTGSIDIEVVSPSSSNTPVYRMGSLDGDVFASGLMTIGLSPLAAGGSSGLGLSIVDTANDDALFTGAVPVTFSSSCTANGLATISPNPATSANGNVSATYVALGCSGSDKITASTVVDGQSLTATGTIEVLPASLGSIEFVSADPTTIGLRGSGLPETSTVVFKVVNSSGGPIANQAVSFALNTAVGGIELEPETGTTDASGQVQTVVRAGTVHTTVRVTATATQGDATVSSQSELLIVSTGLPDQDSFSLSAECFNLEAWEYDGVEAEVTIFAADRFNNPAPDGTAIAFTTEGGAIEGGCTTSGGVCSVTWRSQNPRPDGFNGCDASNAEEPNGTDETCAINGTLGAARPGRATVLATALGEESFTDLNGNGRLDDGEPFDDQPEAWRDDDGDNSYDLDFEEFVDYVENGMRDSGDGLFNGVLCSDNPNCAPVGQRTMTTRQSLTMIMSSSSPAIDNATDIYTDDGTTRTYYSRIENGEAVQRFDIKENQQFLISFILRDLNDQPLPAGTTVALSVLGEGGEIVGTNTITVPCSTNDQKPGNTYTFAFKANEIEDEDVGDTDTPVTLAVELLVTSPRGLVTIRTYTIKIEDVPS